ncbi:hypothetical protein EMIT07CA2_40043 [Brevibacillus sp. IT-7CA2]
MVVACAIFNKQQQAQQANTLLQYSLGADLMALHLDFFSPTWGRSGFDGDGRA